MKRVVIMDCDSLLFMAAYPGKDIFGNANPDYGMDDYEIVESKLSEMIHSILNIIEETYEVERVYMCVKGKDNFRRSLYPTYKAHRPDPPEIVGHLCEFLIREFGAIPGDGYEADDLVYSISSAVGHTGIIVGIDKDLYQIPSLFYNYQKNLFHTVNYDEARYNLAMLILCGDPADGVNLTPRWGRKKSEGVIFKGMSDYQYIKAIYLVYRKIWGVDKCKDMVRLAYKLFRLHEMEYKVNEQVES